MSGCAWTDHITVRAQPPDPPPDPLSGGGIWSLHPAAEPYAIALGPVPGRKAASPLRSSPLACTRSGSFGQPSCCSSPNIAFTTVLTVGFVRGSWLRLRKTSKLVAQFNQGGCCQQMTAAIAWCRRIARHSLRRPGAGHGGTTCGPVPKFASARVTLRCELRNLRTTSNLMILVRF